MKPFIVKRAFSIHIVLLALVLFLQTNHIALLHFGTEHTGSMQPCASAQRNGAVEKCYCCVIEQADKSNVQNTAGHHFDIAPPPFKYFSRHDLPLDYAEKSRPALNGNFLERIATVVHLE